MKFYSTIPLQQWHLPAWTKQGSVNTPSSSDSTPKRHDNNLVLLTVLAAQKIRSYFPLLLVVYKVESTRPTRVFPYMAYTGMCRGTGYGF